MVIVIAVALTWRGLKTDFEKHLDTGRMSRTTFTVVRRLGQVGYVARGGVFFLIGGLVIKAAMDNQPGKAQGFDVALKSLASAPFGQVLLIAAALGLICFGAYCWAEARFPHELVPGFAELSVAGKAARKVGEAVGEAVSDAVAGKP